MDAADREETDMGNTTNPATGDQDMAGYRVRHAAPSLNDDDYVRRDELENLANSRNDARYLKRAPSGTNDAMQADLPFGGHRGTGLSAGVADTDAAIKKQVTDGDAATLTAANAHADAAAAAVVTLPRNKVIFYPSDSDQTWTNTTGKTVTVYVMLLGGDGGKGNGATVSGGKGACVFVAVSVPIGGTITIRVGGKGSNGTAGPFSFKQGGAGGSGTRIIVSGSGTTVVAGGGGGGGAVGGLPNPGSAAGYPGPGGEPAGVGGITDYGGLGGAGSFALPGNTGGNGSSSQASDQALDFLFPVTIDLATGGDGRVVMRF